MQEKQEKNSFAMLLTNSDIGCIVGWVRELLDIFDWRCAFWRIELYKKLIVFRAKWWKYVRNWCEPIL